MNTRLGFVFCLALASGLAACSRDVEADKARLIQSGDQFVAEKKYPEAIVQYRSAVSLDPNFGEARLKLADAYAQTGDVRRALAEYIRAADLMPKNVDAQLKAGTGLLRARQFQDARTRATAALAVEPKNVRALMLMGNALAGLDQMEDAISTLTEAVESSPTQTLAYGNLAALQFSQGNLKEAEAALKQAIEIAPTSPEPRLALANFYWGGNDLVSAERELKAALEIDPKSLATNKALAAFYTLTKRPAEGERFLKTFASLTDDVAPKLVLADFYLVGNRMQEAQAVLQPLLGSNDGFIPAKLRLAAIDFSSGRRPEAHKALDEIFAREPKHEDASLAKARFLLVEGKANEALTMARSVVAANPASVGGYFVLGTALRATGAFAEARTAFLDVLRARPAAVGALEQAADLNLILGSPQAAADFARQAIKIRPSAGAPHIVLARALLSLGDVAAAEREVMGMAKGSPNSADVQMLLGEFYWARKDITRSRAAYERALALRAGSVDALAGIVRADLAEKKGQAAHARLTEQLAKTPNDQALLLLAGTSALSYGDLKHAENMLRRVLQLNPANLEAYVSLGSLYRAQNRLDEARREFEEVVRREPALTVPATLMIATIMGIQGQKDESIKAFEKVLTIDPENAVAANNVAWHYAESGTNLDVALGLAQTAKAKQPDRAEISDTLGYLLYKKGLHSAAVTALEEATSQAPKNASIRYRLALAYLGKGDSDRARGSFNQALQINPTFPEAEDAKRQLASIK